MLNIKTIKEKQGDLDTWDTNVSCCFPNLSRDVYKMHSECFELKISGHSANDYIWC